MKRLRLSGISLLLLSICFHSYAGVVTDTLKYYDCGELTLIGKAHGEPGYKRFPAKYNGVVRKEVWELSEESAGISVRFRSNASTLYVKWTLLHGKPFPHMAWTGIGGLDLYTYQDGRWVFVQTARPSGKESRYLMFENKNSEEREFLLNLPLYDGVESVFIGVNPDAFVSRPVEKQLLQKKPVVYYGSSIAQGASATRPGTAFTHLLSRWLDRPFINFGFSGEGTFDESVGRVMCETDPVLFVVDCNPNSKPGIIYDSAVKLVRQLKRCHPATPVLLVDNFIYDDEAAVPEHTDVRVGPDKKLYHIKWAELTKAYDQLKKEGIKGLYYHKGSTLTGSDREGTVDGSHPTDLGMFRIAQELLPDLKRIIGSAN